MPKNPPGVLGHVPVAVYSCTDDPRTVRAAETRGRHYADSRHWQVAGAWSDLGPAVPLDTRAGWKAVTDALDAGKVRGIVVADTSHIAADPAQFAALGVLLRERGGFLVYTTVSPMRRTPRPAPAAPQPRRSRRRMVIHQRHHGGRGVIGPHSQTTTPYGTPSPHLLERADDGYARFLDGLTDEGTGLCPAFDGAQQASRHPGVDQATAGAR
ncbi:recombinase family protein [Streptomyces sp. NPDC006544]|uniref:recombinase family protein n=1 Tax=Streptomyces sp. NPDC006544 TaxID=3154583 RepID=UPI0033B8FF6E